MKHTILIFLATFLAAHALGQSPPQNLYGLQFKHVHSHYELYLQNSYGPLSAEERISLDRLVDTGKEIGYWAELNLGETDLRLAILDTPPRERQELLLGADAFLERKKAGLRVQSFPTEIEIAILVRKNRREAIRRLIYNQQLKFSKIGQFFVLTTPGFESLLSQHPDMNTWQAYANYVSELRGAISQAVDKLIRNSIDFAGAKGEIIPEAFADGMSRFNERDSLLSVADQRARRDILTMAGRACALAVMP